MILNFSLIISSILLGSTFSKIFAKILVYQKGVNLFSSGLAQNIPSFNLILAQEKSFDILEFLLFAVISIFIFILLTNIHKKRRYSPLQQTLMGLGNIIFAFFVYLSTVFANYSGVKTIVFTFLWYFTVSAASFLIPKTLPTWSEGKRAFFNGIVTGFYLLILFNNLTTSIALPLATFATVPIYFYIFSKQFRSLSNPAFMLLILSSIFPFNRLILFGIALITTVLIFATRKINFSNISAFIEKVYPIIILLIFLYNPIFYLGTFDSIEEGFWAGWLQRLLAGQFMYRDFAAYHPPALVWGLYSFTKIFGASLFNLRLYFHLLQIFGLVILYMVLGKIAKSKIIQIGIFVLIIAYGSTLVRNNIEIRVGSAIAPLLFVYWHNLNKKRVSLLIAGGTAALAFFISLETGIASIVAVIVAACLSSSKKTLFKNLLYVFLGGITISLPVLAFLTLNGATSKFIEYLVYYTGIFASGYLNSPIGQIDPQTLLQWYLVIKYTNTSGFLWELTKFSLMAGLFFVIIKKTQKKFGPTDVLTAGIAIFGFVLSRNALGRSDAYHIAFVWIPALLLIAYLLQFISHYSKSIIIAVLCILIFFIGRDATQVSLIQNQLIKFETYGNPSGSYPSYATRRAGIITGIDTDPKEMDSLVTFVDSTVGKNETIFVFPLEPEIYFLTDRNNATSFDTPTAFYTLKYQNQMIKELTDNPPKLIIYKKNFETQVFTNDTLHEVNEYILKNYKILTNFGKELVMQHI